MFVGLLVAALGGTAWLFSPWKTADKPAKEIASENNQTGGPASSATNIQASGTGAATALATVRNPAVVDPPKIVSGEEYILSRLLDDVRGLPADDRRFVRYFSINHLLAGGGSVDQLEQQRAALAVAINHLSWESRIVNLRVVDAPSNTLFAVDIRELGWQRRPFFLWRDNAAADKSPVSLFDLVLLEYPYGLISDHSEIFGRLSEQYLTPAEQIRPTPYLRADWFVSNALQSPLYEDLLQLPQTVGELERRLGVDAPDAVDPGVARRAGLSASAAAPGGRVVERRNGKYGAYWKAFDFEGGNEWASLAKDPMRLPPVAVDALFALPNGLQGYFLASKGGQRTPARSAGVLVDRFAADRTARNGLSCIRCHAPGVSPVKDAMRSTLQALPAKPGFDLQGALQLYPEQAVLDRLVREDGERFRTALGQIKNLTTNDNPLPTVTRRFLDEPLALSAAAGELGIKDPATLEAKFRGPEFVSLDLAPLSQGGGVRREVWEKDYDRIVRGLGLGTVIVPWDGLVRASSPAGSTPLDVELKTNKPNNQFEPGDALMVSVVNRSSKPLHIELVGTSSRGRMVILASEVVVNPGATFRFPAEGSPPIKIKGGLGRERITLYASEASFPAGELLHGEGVNDRVVHPFYEWNRSPKGLILTHDLARLVKITIDIETR